MNNYQAIRPRSSAKRDEDTPPNQSPNPVVESSVSVGHGRKRKAPTHVSQNACTNCKKARAKCDGVEGQPCSRCNSRSLPEPCHYELHVKTQKEKLLGQIRDWQNKNDRLRFDLEDKERWIDRIMEHLGRGTKGFRVLERLNVEAEGEPYQELLDALASPPSSARQNSIDIRSDGDDAMEIDDDHRWTSVTSNRDNVDHFVALYMAWVHPVHMFFSDRHFKHSFTTNDHTYCSSALVNAICAMGCFYSVDKGISDAHVKTLGRRFAQQVLLELKNEKQPMSLLSVITYAILFLIELSSGQASKAADHLRLAVETLREIDRDEWPDEVFEIAFFGIHTLNTDWHALTYLKPPAPLSRHSLVFQHVGLDTPEQPWLFYQYMPDAGTPTDADAVPAHAIETAREMAKLSLINAQTINMWCHGPGKVTVKMVISIYKDYETWKDQLSPALSRVDSTSTQDLLPYILLLHIKYSVAICQLFNPFLEYKGLSVSAKKHVRHVIVESARHGKRIYQRFCDHFKNRYQSPLQAYCLVHLCDTLLRHDNVDKEETVSFCLRNLGDALPGFPVVGPLQAMFCESVVASGHERLLTSEVDRWMGGKKWTSFTMEDRLGCTERKTYTQPVDALVASVDPKFADTFKEEWDAYIENNGAGQASEEERRRESMQINSLMNP